jgi:hypothetical protein
MKDKESIDRLLSKCEQVGNYEVAKWILTALLNNSYIFDNFSFFKFMTPLSNKGDYEMPVRVLNEIIKHNAFPAHERDAVKHLLSLQLKDLNYHVDKTMDLFYKVMKVPDVVDNSFSISVLKALWQRGQWDHFDKVCHLSKHNSELFEEMIDWGVEKKQALHPSVQDVLESLTTLRNENPLTDLSSHLFNHLAETLMKYKRLDVNLEMIDAVF